MNDWITVTRLTEVFQQGVSTPTWRPSNGPKRATLNRVLVAQVDQQQVDLTVQWRSPLITFDHALLIIRIQHPLIGTGYAGACRPDRDAFPQSRCRVNPRKWKENVGEWNRLLLEGLRVMSEKHHDHPPESS